ncbi:MAG TPA: response regulator, partial [Candidatus Competibacteraceae bacterium]|nr:response regulator [Candidatus Competibacteraceae bacterium]
LPVPSKHHSRILVIEDNDTMRLLITTLLEESGYEVVEAVDGMSALMAAENDPPALAVLDLHLPDVSGLEIASLFHQRIPFLVLTVDADDDFVQKCIDLGALGYLVKPPEMDGFLRQVRIALERGQETLNLRRALHETQVISKAVGVLMAYHALSEETAYQQLLSFAIAHKRRTAEVAKELISTFGRWMRLKATGEASTRAARTCATFLDHFKAASR